MQYQNIVLAVAVTAGAATIAIGGAHVTPIIASICILGVAGYIFVGTLSLKKGVPKPSDSP